ncbi:protrudin isoform X1 [Pseudorca crassidens]|uniref:protrudin isoform X1 n=1 Tax=Pseudorca crassidens TaxID=82174 RepID=UPI00352D414C
MQTSEREGCGPEVSPSMVPEAPLESPTAPAKSPAFDLFNLVLSYKRLEIYLEPLKDAGDGVRYLLRWQTPLCSLLTCLGLNILFLTLNEGAWYSVGALMISVPALLGYLQEVCRARLPESELMRRKYHSVRQEDLQRVRLSRPEAVAEVKSFLIQLEAFLSRLCCTCEAVYRVLHWENPTVSSQFYGALLGTVCMLYLLPLCWVLALLNSTLFLGNVEFFRVVSEYRASLQRRMNPKQEESAFESPPPSDAGGKGALPDCTPAPAPTPTEDLTPGSVEEAEEAEPDEEFKDAIEPKQAGTVPHRGAWTSHCGARTSRRGGLSRCRAWALGARPPAVAARGLSSCGSRVPERRLSSCGARAQLLRGTWDPPRPGLEPVSPALAGGLPTTVTPGKPYGFSYSWKSLLFMSLCKVGDTRNGGFVSFHQAYDLHPARFTIITLASSMWAFTFSAAKTFSKT